MIADDGTQKIAVRCAWKYGEQRSAVGLSTLASQGVQRVVAKRRFGDRFGGLVPMANLPCDGWQRPCELACCAAKQRCDLAQGQRRYVVRSVGERRVALRTPD